MDLVNEHEMDLHLMDALAPEPSYDGNFDFIDLMNMDGSFTPPESQSPQIVNYPGVDLISPYIVKQVEPSIVIPKCSKGQDYTLKEETGILGTKKGLWIPLDVTGNPGSLFCAKIVYEKKQYRERKVECCTTCDSKYFLDIYLDNIPVLEKDGTYTAVLDGRSTLNLKIKFNCWNSCPPHAPYGKKTLLQLSLYNNNSEQVLESNVIVRVCAAPKRDLEIADENGIVAYSKIKKCKNEPMPQKVKVKTEPASSAPIGIQQPWILFEIHSKRDEKMVVDHIERCGGVQRSNSMFRMQSPGDEKLIVNLIERLGGVQRPINYNSSTVGIKDLNV